jgi:tyrosinase
MTQSAVDPGAAFVHLMFNGFSPSLEGTPHNVVHTSVGGGSGWMSAFETAARDPIFWLHHAQIDRLWESWLAMGGGRANPTTPTWLNTSFQFYNETGATVNMTGAQIVDTAAQLNYRYAHPACRIIGPYRLVWQELTRIPPFDPRALELVNLINRRPPLPTPPAPILIQESLRLGAGPAVVRMPVGAESKRALERFHAGGQEGGTQITLVLEDIRLEQPPEVFYEVYVNLPSSVRNPEYTSPHYVGNIDFFGPGAEQGHHKMPFRRTLSLLPAYVRLRAAGRWSDEGIHLTFVPRGPTEGEVPERLLRQRPQATIGRVSLRIE